MEDRRGRKAEPGEGEPEGYLGGLVGVRLLGGDQASEGQREAAEAVGEQRVVDVGDDGEAAALGEPA